VGGVREDIHKQGVSLILAPDAAGHASAARALESADVVVIGAGPAGSAAAAHLRAAGLDVIVLERAHPTAARTGPAALAPRAVGQRRAFGVSDSDTGATTDQGAGVLQQWLTALPVYALTREAPMTRIVRHVTTSTGTPVETSVTPPTMVTVTRAAAHPGTERGVDQR